LIFNTARHFSFFSHRRLRTKGKSSGLSSRLLSGSCTEDISYWDITKSTPLFINSQENSQSSLIGLKLFEESFFWMASQNFIQCIDTRQGSCPGVYFIDKTRYFTAFDILNTSYLLAKLTTDFTTIIFHDTRKIESPSGKIQLKLLTRSSKQLKKLPEKKLRKNVLHFSPFSEDMISISGQDNNVYIFNTKDRTGEIPIDAHFTHNGHFESGFILNHIWNNSDCITSTGDDSSVHIWKLAPS